MYEGVSGMNETIDLEYLSLTLNRFALPASFQSKLSDQQHSSLVFVSTVQMHVYSPLFGMWSRHWKTADPRAERELYLRPERT